MVDQIIRRYQISYDDLNLDKQDLIHICDQFEIIGFDDVEEIKIQILHYHEQNDLMPSSVATLDNIPIHLLTRKELRTWLNIYGFSLSSSSYSNNELIGYLYSVMTEVFRDLHDLEEHIEYEHIEYANQKLIDYCYHLELEFDSKKNYSKTAIYSASRYRLLKQSLMMIPYPLTTGEPLLKFKGIGHKSCDMISELIIQNNSRDLPQI